MIGRLATIAPRPAPCDLRLATCDLHVPRLRRRLPEELAATADDLFEIVGSVDAARAGACIRSCRTRGNASRTGYLDWQRKVVYNTPYWPYGRLYETLDAIDCR